MVDLPVSQSEKEISQNPDYLLAGNNLSFNRKLFFKRNFDEILKTSLNGHKTIRLFDKSYEDWFKSEDGKPIFDKLIQSKIRFILHHKFDLPELKQTEIEFLPHDANFYVELGYVEEENMSSLLKDGIITKESYEILL